MKELKADNLNVIILRGLPASGKSTWARELMEKQDKGRWKRINRDELRMMLDGDFWDRSCEDFVKMAETHLILTVLAQGYNVIVDSTNLNLEQTNNLLGAIGTGCKQGSYGAVSVVFKNFFDVPVDECIKRDIMRERPVGEGVIRSLNKRLQALLNEADYEKQQH